MFDWLRSKRIAPAKKFVGFFSTDLGLGMSEQDIPSQIAKSFQKKAGEFRKVTPEGVGLDGASDDCLKPNVAINGDVIPYNQICYYASQGFIGYQFAAMLAQHWLIDKCCAMPARDAMRHGYEITVNDGSDTDVDFISKITEIDKAFKIKKQATEFINMGRVFGIRIAMFDVAYQNSDKAYEAPFNIDAVTPGSYRGICQIDPYWITPELDAQAAANPASRHFYEPTWWRVNGKRIHRSHLVIFRNGELADILKPTYMYGGIPVPQKIAERVYAAERTANEAPALALSKRSTLIHADLNAALANQAEFDQRMLLWAQYRDNYGIKVMGLEEEAEQFDTSLADFDAVIMTQYQIVAAAANVPATKLLGTSPKGFNATGEFEADSYHEELETIQENDIQPLIDRHHELVMKSLFPNSVTKISIKWNAVDSPSAKEQAEINKLKAETGNALATSGAIDGTDERERIVNDKESGYNGIALVVPDGPGDREHEQEVAAALLENTNAPEEGKTEKKEQVNA